MAMRRSLRRDLSGAFPVFEAILVAVIVLTSILFFTSVQRPTTGGDLGGIDLAQTASDTLAILETRTFSGSSMETWVGAVLAGNASGVSVGKDVRQLLNQTLPTGARYTLRLDNGVSSLRLLPTGAEPTPNGARASQLTLLPTTWAKYHTGALTTFPAAIHPGQILDASHPARALVDPASTTYNCIEAPLGSTTLRDGPDADTAADTWRSHWQAPAGSPHKANDYQVPLDIPYGTWRVSTAAAGAGGCDTTPLFVKVVRPGCVVSSPPPDCASPYVPYGLQLVVWFGA
jgi:hypothetical protein